MNWRGTLLGLVFLLAAMGAPAAEDTEFFEKKVRPVLAERCYGCHGADKQFGGLRVDSRDSILKGGARGPAAVTGKPDDSLLVKAVRHQGLQMPMGGKLKTEEIDALAKWVSDGMAWPAEKAPVAKAARAGMYGQWMKEHWAFQPVRKVAAPAGKGNPIDAFVTAKLKQAGLGLNGKAEKRVLARRASFIATGLPPKEADLRAFLDDKSAGAYEKYVDKLLASPHYGEHWARHWMDLVRYAETYGYEWNYEIQGAWRYRDYLIRAFNSDVPYDRFVREHIAGDLIDARNVGGVNQSILGTAFFRLGEMGHDDCIEFRELRTDVVDNQIDTLTKAFQGLTVSCARCHDHKIDPVPTEDYYALYGVLNSTRPVTRTLNGAGVEASKASRLVQIKTDIRKETAAVWLKDASEMERYLRAAQAAIADASDAPAKAQGLDAHRLDFWVRLLRREKVDVDDPLYALVKLASGGKWKEIREKFTGEANARAENAKKYVPFGDFQRGVPAGWSTEGLGVQAGQAAAGEFAVAGEGEKALAGVYPSGIYSNLLSDRLNGVLRSPLLPKDKKYLSMQVVGGNLGAYRAVVDHCVIGENHTLIENAAPAWVTLKTQSDQKLPIYVELSTKVDNPRFPERPGKFAGLTEESYAKVRSNVGIIRAVLHDDEGAPKASIDHLKSLYDGGAEEVVAHLSQRSSAALQAWADGKATDADVSWINWMLAQGVLINSRNVTPRMRELTEEYRRVERTLNEPEVVYGMGDFDPGVDQPIFTGGQATKLGRPAPRHFLSLMPANLRQPASTGSGRLEVAEAIASKENPLTSRVMVNRVWHWVFGRGIVGTTDNFGRYGDAPTHPELLDYLATKYVDDGWSTKKLVRMMLTSATFMQQSAASAEVVTKDPENKLWSRYPVRRLEAESVRDSILAASGMLDGTLYGPSIEPYRKEAKEYRRLFAGPLDGKGRRSIYLKVTRMEGARFLELFDFPIPMQTRGKRDVTNVPTQALALLNDPFVIDQAKVWADQLVAKSDDAVDARIAAMFERTLARAPSAEELKDWRGAVNDFAAKHGVSGDAVLKSKPVWQDVAHTFFNLKEFLYLL